MWREGLASTIDPSSLYILYTSGREGRGTGASLAGLAVAEPKFEQNSAHVHTRSCVMRISVGPSEIVCYSKCLAQCAGSCMTVLPEHCLWSTIRCAGFSWGNMPPEPPPEGTRRTFLIFCACQPMLTSFHCSWKVKLKKLMVNCPEHVGG